MIGHPPTRRRYRRRRVNGWVWLLVALAAGLAIWGFVDYSKTSTVTFTVKDKLIDSSGKQRVYTDSDTFVVKDSVVIGRFDSSRLYGELTEGQTYTCTVVGWRVPLFSMFKNIKECDFS